MVSPSYSNATSLCITVVPRASSVFCYDAEGDTTLKQHPAKEPSGRCCLPCRNVLNKVWNDKRYPTVSTKAELMEHVLNKSDIKQDFLNGRTEWIKKHSKLKYRRGQIAVRVGQCGVRL